MRLSVARHITGTALERPLRWLARRPRRTDTFAVRKNQQYDAVTAELIQRVVRPHTVAVDAGANRGVFLAEFLRVAPEGQHHAFEPIPELAQDLRRRFPTARVHQAALADFDGEATFHYLPADPAESSLHTRPEREMGREVVNLNVRVQLLDDVVEATEEISFIKIDVEGAEIALLKGAGETLRRCRPVVVIECHVDQLGAITDLFEAAELQVHLMDDFAAGVTRARADTQRLAAERGEFYFVAAPRA